MTRVRGTTEFMSEQAVKPVINVSSKVAQWRAMVRVATGKDPSSAVAQEGFSPLIPLALGPTCWSSQPISGAAFVHACIVRS